MMKTALTILIILFSNLIYAQNHIEINNDKPSYDFYKNLEESLKNHSIEGIQNSNVKVIRLWRGQEVFNFSSKSFYVRKFTNLETGLSYTYKQSLVNKIDTLNIEKLKLLKAEFPIDCFPIAVETTENDQYFLKVLGCNREIATLIREISNNEIKSNIEQFIKGLPSGEYWDYMVTFSINQPVTDSSKKTNLYREFEKELLENKINIENPASQPLVIINSKTVYFEDVNKLDKRNLKSYKILNGRLGIIYGTKGQNGALIIQTK